MELGLIRNMPLDVSSRPSRLDKLIYRRLNALAVAPARSTNDSAGYVLCSAEQDKTVLKPSERAAISTGLKLEFPPGSYGRICGRFSNELYRRFSVLPGCVDPNHPGPVQVILLNNSNSPVEIHPGDKIALLVLERHYIVEVEEDVSMDDPGVPFVEPFVPRGASASD